MAFPPVADLVDDFDRPETPLGGAVASGGDTWSPSQIQGGTTSANTNAAGQLVTPGGANCFLLGDYDQDQFWMLDVPVLPGSGDYIALWGRLQDPGTPGFGGYLAIWLQDLGWRIGVIVGGSITYFGSWTNVTPLGAGDAIAFSLIGPELTAYAVSGGVETPTFQVEDATWSGGGRFGIEGSGNTGRYDNLVGGSIVASGPVYEDAVSGSVLVTGAMLEGLGFDESAAGLLVPAGLLLEGLGFDDVAAGDAAAAGAIAEAHAAGATLAGGTTAEGALLERLAFHDARAGGPALAGVLGEAVVYRDALTGELIAAGALAESWSRAGSGALQVVGGGIPHLDSDRVEVL